MLTRFDKCPWPYFGGKSEAAPAIWEALGDVAHFVDPFMGSLAVILRRPHPCNRPYFSETVNDADGLLCNAWRSIQMSPDATAEAASWPVCEADLHARHLGILKWQKEREIEHLMGDPDFHDPKIAGWWIWGQSCWIGSGFASGRGPWVIGADGRIAKRTGGGGVNRKLPHLGDNGRGVNHAGTREPGVSDAECVEFRPVTMPEIRRWFAFLSARLRHVRILNGDWKRAVTDGASVTLSVRKGIGPAGYFLDPPYAVTGNRADGLYTNDDGDKVSVEVRAWCRENGADPRKRIVLAGYAGEGHEELEDIGWTQREWFAGGWLKGGMGNTRKSPEDDDGPMNQQHRERLWLSPHCLRPEAARQATLWEGVA